MVVRNLTIGITMHSSAISLIFDMDNKSKGDASTDNTDNRYLVNLIDCPGYICYV